MKNQKKTSFVVTVGAGFLVAAVLFSTTRASAETLYGLGANNTLLSFDSATPGTVTLRPIIGADALVGIDLRPANGTLLGVSSSRLLYTIDLLTGTASALSGTPFTLSTAGTTYGFDFNPTVDRIRIVNDAAENFRANPNDGTAIVDGTLAYAVGDSNFGLDPAIMSTAYDNNFAGALSTALWALDSRSDTLARINPANSGVLNTMGSLGINFTSTGGFDISGSTGNAYAALMSPGGVSTLYQIDLANGAATSLGIIGFNGDVIGLTVVPEPSTWALFAIGLCSLVAIARRRRQLKN